jgi:hypothetical protein
MQYVQKLVIEIRYKPHLSFYGRMDELGVALEKHFEHWQRSPLTLELRNRKQQRRLFLSHRRSFFECDHVKSATAELEHGRMIIDRVRSTLELEECDRVGVRQWFVVDLDRTFPALNNLLCEKLFFRDERLSAVAPDRCVDMSYVSTHERVDGSRYNVLVGPMERDEYFQKVPHEQEIYGDGSENEELTFAAYKEKIPQTFVLVDIDFYKETLPRLELKNFINEAYKVSEDTAQRLIDYLGGQ